MASAAAAKKWPRPFQSCGWLAADQPEVGLVDQGGRLERLAGLLRGQPGGGELAQLVVDERQQLGRGLRVAGRGRVEQAGDVGHAGECTTTGTDPRPEKGDCGAGRARTSVPALAWFLTLVS